MMMKNMLCLWVLSTLVLVMIVGKLLFENEWYELQTGEERHELFCTECYEERIRNDGRYYHEMMSHFPGK